MGYLADCWDLCLVLLLVVTMASSKDPHSAGYWAVQTDRYWDCLMVVGMADLKAVSLVVVSGSPLGFRQVDMMADK